MHGDTHFKGSDLSGPSDCFLFCASKFCCVFKSNNFCFLVHNIVRNFTADYDKTLIFNKIHHELNQVSNYKEV